MEERVVHCWAGNEEIAIDHYGIGSDQHLDTMDNPGTCMLLDGHKGDHEFTPDGNIVITFPEKDSTP